MYPNVSDDSNGAGGLTGRAGKNRRSNRNSRRGRGRESDEDYMEDERDVEYGSWSKSELFRMEKSVLTFGYVFFSRFFYDTFSKELFELGSF